MIGTGRREPPSLFALVPAALGETAEGDEPDERDHDPEPHAPHDRDHHAHDGEHAPERQAKTT